MSTNGNWTQKSILHGVMKTLKIWLHSCENASLDSRKRPFYLRFITCKNINIESYYDTLKIKSLKYQSSLWYLVRYML